jgi:hypothetical protein
MSVLGKVWDEAVGTYEWLKSLTLGEFAEDRPTSVIVTDMLFAMTVPGAVVVTSARDLAAVCLRLGRRYEGRSTAEQNAAHPEWQEWIILIASAIGVFGPMICAAVGALVGALIGDEAAAFLRALCLLLIREGEVVLTKVVGFLARFAKGNVVKLLEKVRFADYGTKLAAELQQFIKRMIGLIAKVQRQLSRIEYFERAKELLAQLERMEARFYAVQARVADEIPKALSKLDEELQRLLKDTLPPVHHPALAGVQAVKPAVKAVDKLRVSSGIGEPSRPLLQAKVESEASGAERGASPGGAASGGDSTGSVQGGPHRDTLPEPASSNPNVHSDNLATLRPIPPKLYHYTNEKGMQGILNSKELRPSLKSVNPKDVRYGNGQYLSDIKPGTKTPDQLSRLFINNPFQGRRYTHFIEISTKELHIIEGRTGVYVVPNETSLNVSGRITASGKVEVK